jgi:hypothetical protein
MQSRIVALDSPNALAKCGAYLHGRGARETWVLPAVLQRHWGIIKTGRPSRRPTRPERAWNHWFEFLRGATVEQVHIELVAVVQKRPGEVGGTGEAGSSNLQQRRKRRRRARNGT